MGALKPIVGAIAVSLIVGCKTTTNMEDQTTVSTVQVQGSLENGSFTATLDEFEIHYEVHGKGPVLMTVPNSWGLTLSGLRTLYKPLEQYVTMVYFDPRGMGASGKIREERDMSMAAVRSDFDALRRHLRLEKVNAIGWSNGAMNLIYLAAEKPDILSSAIFLHGTAYTSPEDDKIIIERYPELVAKFGEFKRILEDRISTEEEKNNLIKAFYTQVWFPYLFANKNTAMEKLPTMYENAGFSSSHAKYSEEETSGFDTREILKTITVRSLVLAGRHDMITVDRSQELGQLIPGADFTLFENSGHFAPVEEPEAFVQKVLDFLEIKR